MGTVSEKSGKGAHHGLISEESVFLTIKRGHTEALREACQRFYRKLRSLTAEQIQRLGLTDMRHVIFDAGTRLCWTTSFETDWDPYIDDSLDLLGLEVWFDWLQHCEECPDNLLELTHEQLRAFIQASQVTAVGFFRALPDVGMAQIQKGQRVLRAFEHVLEQPGAALVMQQPLLEPLLEEAAY